MRHIPYILFVLCLLAFAAMARAQNTDGALQHDGQTRTFTLHVPASYVADTPVPLLIVLQRGAYSGQEMRALTGFDAIADREGFIVVYPDGVDGSWNDGLGLEMLTTVQQNTDDVGFMAALIDHLVQTYAIDAARIYVTGFSSGGNLSYLLACQLTDRIAAFVPVGSLMMQKVADDCVPSQPISMLLIQGTEDAVFAWGGGQFVVEDVDYGYQFSTAQTLDFWLTHNACSSTREFGAVPDVDPDDNTRVWHEAYTACEGNTSVELYAVIEGGHNWSGVASDLSRDVGGTVSYDLNASEVIWSFLSRQRLGE